MNTVEVSVTVERIRQMAAQHLEVNLADLTVSSHFVDDCGADSLSLIDLLAAVEREYNVVIDQSRLEHMVSVNAVYEVLADVAGW